jgi:uncharacterized protein YjdB
MSHAMDSIRFFSERVQRFVLLAAIAFSSACASHEPTSPLLDASLSITSGGQSIFEIHQTLQLTAIVRDTSGATLAGQSVRWASSDTTIASVSTTGVVTGKNAGSVIITATCDGTQATIPLTVAPPIAGVFVAEAPVGELAVGGSMQVYATAVAANGDTITGLPASWSSSNNSLATVAPFNIFVANVSAVTAGNVSITATVAGVSGSTTVSVVPLAAATSVRLNPATVTIVAGPVGFGAGTQMALFVTDANGNQILGVPIAWSISDTSAATISATGLITPNPAVFYASMATAAVTAAVAGMTASSSVFVCPPVASISVSTTAMGLSVGQTIKLAASALDAHGHLERVALASAIAFPNVRVVTLQSAGIDTLLVTGVAPGNATLVFSYGTVQSQAVAITVGSTESSVERDDRLSILGEGLFVASRVHPVPSRRPKALTAAQRPDFKVSGGRIMEPAQR